MIAPLEIHHINVSQGDSTLIIHRNLAELENKIKNMVGKPTEPEKYLPFAINNKVDLEGTVISAVLIDGGEDNYGGDVFEYIQAYGVKGSNTQKNFYTVATHYHSDHVDGLRCIFWEKADHKNNNFVMRYPPKIAYDCGDDPKLDPDTLTYQLYTKEVGILQGKGITTRKTADLNTVIDLGTAWSIPINMRCVASNGYVKSSSNIPVSIIDRNNTPDQNSRSVCFVLEFGEFRYFLGGDIGGDGKETGGNFNAKKDSRDKKFFSSHPDIETSVRGVLQRMYKQDTKRPNTIDGHMCCFKANHHGSSSSNDTYFLETMQPKVVAVSSGTKRQFHGHPTQEFFNRVDKSTAPQYSSKWPVPSSSTPNVNNTVDSYYITEMSVNGTYNWGGKKRQSFTRTEPSGKFIGDIIVRPSFEDIQKVSAKTGNSIAIQVYGTGIQSNIDPGDKNLVPNDTTTNAPYPIGPWTHTCARH